MRWIVTVTNDENGNINFFSFEGTKEEAKKVLSQMAKQDLEDAWDYNEGDVPNKLPECEWDDDEDQMCLVQPGWEGFGDASTVYTATMEDHIQPLHLIQ